MTLAWVALVPWVAILVFVRFGTRFPTELPRGGDGTGSAGLQAAPFVSVIVPARNEAHNIERCVGSLVSSDYPDFEVVVVDDGSHDETAALARAMPRGQARAVRVLDGAPLPAGWLGKPWACLQAAKAAAGDVLLFTDADTEHAPDLLARAVRGLQEEEAHLLTLVGRQEMRTFWERLLQPHVFLGMLFRFPDFERVARNHRWRDAIANGQYIMMPRDAYWSMGGHEAVRDEVVEDLALAQQVKRAGLRLRVRAAEDGLSTRMYRSLDELVAGWSKNLILGGQQTFPRWMRPLIPPVALTSSVALWLLPPVVLGVSVGGMAWAAWAEGSVGAAATTDVSLAGVSVAGASLVGAAAWSAGAVVAGVLLFGWFSRRMGAPAMYGLLYPVGAALTAYIFLRSWVRGRNVTWKGRAYRVPAAGSRP